MDELLEKVEVYITIIAGIVIGIINILQPFVSIYTILTRFIVIGLIAYFSSWLVKLYIRKYIWPREDNTAVLLQAEDEDYDDLELMEGYDDLEAGYDDLGMPEEEMNLEAEFEPDEPISDDEPNDFTNDDDYENYSDEEMYDEEYYG